jgi:hypothetical protein
VGNLYLNFANHESEFESFWFAASWLSATVVRFLGCNLAAWLPTIAVFSCRFLMESIMPPKSLPNLPSRPLICF